MLLSFSLPDMLPELIDGLYGDYLQPCDRARYKEQSDWCEQIMGLRAEDRHTPKMQTIRAYHPDTSPARSPYRTVKPGDTAHIWWKSRTAERRKLGSPTITGVQTVRLSNHAGSFVIALPTNSNALLDAAGIIASRDGQNAFARADGFKDARSMRDYFVPKDGDVFHGVLISWKPTAN